MIKCYERYHSENCENNDIKLINKNSEIGATVDIQKLLIRIVKLVKRYMIWCFRVTFFSFLFPVSLSSGSHFFSFSFFLYVRE